jgi:tRNA threonylcarbamoyladenosine biosynthesis protein TsaB
MDKPGLLLAIDTSTTQAGVAVYDGQVRAELLWTAGRNHARQLMPAIRSMLDQLGCAPSGLTVVAAARGPGSFTGLRVGLAAARGLAFALGIPLYGIGSLDVQAAGLPACPWPIRAVLDAGRGRFATALYRREHDAWARAEEVVGVDLGGLLRLADERFEGERCAISGEFSDEVRGRLAELGERVWVAPPSASVRRPAVLAELAWRAWQRGATPRPGDGEPIYLPSPVVPRAVSPAEG